VHSHKHTATRSIIPSDIFGSVNHKHHYRNSSKRFAHTESCILEHKLGKSYIVKKSHGRQAAVILSNNGISIYSTHLDLR